MPTTPVQLRRDRPWPDRAADLRDAALGFLQFVHTTCVNKIHGLDENQARATPLPTSPVMSVLGLVKHLTAVQRQHIQRHIGGSDLPLLWRASDTTYDFRVGPEESIASVVAAFDQEWQRSQQTLAEVDWDSFAEVYGQQVRVARLVVDVLQESARHLGHLDIARELIDGATGE
jgi:uncharacterized damage-inducible protein DinB